MDTGIRPERLIVAGVDCTDEIDRIVAEAPPLSPEEIEHIRFLLRAPIPQRRDQGCAA